MPKSRPLDEKMQFDHVVAVYPGGMIRDSDHGFHAPESLIETLEDGSILKEHEDAWRESVETDGWEVFTYGYSGQYSYSGPIMHASEYIGSRLELDILDNPGLYVAVLVACGSSEHNENPEPAGWAILRHDFPPARLLSANQCRESVIARVTEILRRMAERAG